MHGNRIRPALALTALLATLFMVAPSPATATAYSQPALTYSSNGADISGWNWVRGPGQQATWTFDIAALAPASARSVHLNVSALVTNRASGGSGYSAKGVKFLLSCDPARRPTRVAVNLFNPFRPLDPADSGGVGYAAYGSSPTFARLLRSPGCTTLTVTTAYPYSAGRHIGFRSDSVTLGFNR